ncbi:YfkD famly protein [Pseudalkalibacillus berkeleyi]|uniref:YfkD family protein n=1 Tax=Pseudalkalibacillus berkeleyi TaxID=1069813 RepID=A0ABS9H690_9BACL|nr:YfkD famly protein [Pseudalkalibacillus berkeleyi]MCF6139298.1 YfkD family protein [Pseudalkalibacillus berkeleyi]
MRKLGIMIACIGLLLWPDQVFSADKSKQATEKVSIPNSTVSISKENSYPNATQDLPDLQPSELTRDMFSTTDVKIDNPELIRLFNESHISPTKTAIGYRANIYLGQWPLSYESSETNVNWEYHKVNVNQLNNRGGNAVQQLRFVQENEQKVSGGLTAKVANSDDVQKMMMIKASEKTQLPLSFTTVIGRGTKKDNVYNIPPKKVGLLSGYVPAVNEKGRVTYGEVYIVLKGSKKRIEVKNVTHQGIGAWIPVQDYITLRFNMTN